jgi:hypothetical protein
MGWRCYWDFDIFSYILVDITQRHLLQIFLVSWFCFLRKFHAEHRDGVR